MEKIDTKKAYCTITTDVDANYTVSGYLSPIMKPEDDGLTEIWNRLVEIWNETDIEEDIKDQGIVFEPTEDGGYICRGDEYDTIVVSTREVLMKKYMPDIVTQLKAMNNPEEGFNVLEELKKEKSEFIKDILEAW